MTSELFQNPRNFGELPPEDSSLDKARIVVLPVPYDSTSEFRTGSREGPQAIIDVSHYLELYDIELDREISEAGICTLPPAQVLMSGPEQMVARVGEIAAGLVDKGKLVVMLGGEHSITLGMVQAFRRHYHDLSVLQLDAHLDLRDEYQGTKYSHACVMRRVRDLCPVVHAGVRSVALEEHIFVKENDIPVFYAEDFARPGIERSVLSGLSDHVYVSIDLDVFDPSIMAAVGTPEPAGLDWQDVTRLLKAVASNRKIVGFDIVELCPSEGPTACAFLAAKLAYKLMGYATLL